MDAIQKLRGSYSVNVLTVLSYAIAVDSSKFNFTVENKEELGFFAVTLHNNGGGSH